MRAINRNSNIELLKIVALLLIVCSHTIPRFSCNGDVSGGGIL